MDLAKMDPANKPSRNHPGLNKSGLKGRGLSGKLLSLTLAFIMLAEVLVFLPSIGRALQVMGDQLVIELERGVLVFEVLGDGDEAAQTIGGHFTQQQAEALQMQLLKDTGWIAFAARLPGNRSLMAGSPQAARQVDLQQINPFSYMGHALRILVDFGPPKTLLFSGQARDGSARSARVDIWLDDASIRAELRAYAGRIFLISLGISLFAAALVYVSLRRLIVHPIERLRAALSGFATSPQDPSTLVQPSPRRDEIGVIEAETRAMQETIASTLQQKERLAALGGAVAQVNHDLRGMLSTALLLSDSLESSKDPRVAKAAPVLANSIERAVELCAATLKFAKGSDMAVTAIPTSVSGALQPLINDWRARWPGLKIQVQKRGAVQAMIDDVALTRILDNLVRNAVEAGSPSLHISWTKADGMLQLKIADAGPGLDAKAQADLFVPFKGSTKRDGTGLGLANAADLAEAMGGKLELTQTGPKGTIFALSLICVG